MADLDLPFPACCATCPHRNTFTASCTHEFRQSVLREVREDRTCPVYAEAKTEAMRTLEASIDDASYE